MQTIRKIASFQVDHTLLEPGLYLSRVDGDVTTYDLRTRKPNTPDLMDHSTMHSLEHMLATYLRNGPLGPQVIYFGPMGCQTGFYLLVRDAHHPTVRKHLIQALEQTLSHAGEIFGNSEVECGNYRSLDLQKAKDEARRYLEVLRADPDGDLTYRTK